MTEILVYDKAKYHLEGDFPKDLPKRQAYVHTGMFVAWLALNALFSQQSMLDFKEAMSPIQKGVNPPASLYVAMDGVLSSDMLSVIGNAFAQYYFDFEKGLYLEDYENILCCNNESFFDVADTWENYHLIAAKITRRFATWQASCG